MKILPKTYAPSEIEDKLYEKWMDGGYFHAEVDPDKKPFTIVMPPPNITGQLHMGHALDNTMQDILIRYKRMQGYSALWQPGTDHAAIATEVKVIDKLKKEGRRKEDLGREGFLRECWAWREEYGSRIIQQLRKLGSSADWDRERFTMDDGCSAAVKEVFIRLYEKGYIYKGSRIINWCPVCQTSISDAEVEHVDQDGFFWHINYPIVGEEGRFVEIATTRPETLLGDTAVAVNPEDERYQDLVGKMLELPLTGRQIPVIADEYVDKEFGTGCVKITPAHDPNDFEVGKRHGLEEICILHDDATIDLPGSKYDGMDRYEARKEMVKDLEELGLLVKVVPHSHAVGTHDRCKTTVEPMIKPQWFVAMEEMAKPAIAALKNGTLKFVPESYGKTYLNWLEGIHDWCISRQLWWGHRIPAWYCDDCGEMSVCKDEPKVCPKCGSAHIRQDEDTLDTWFSSALWPFSTLGWPEKTPELDYFYQTDVLVTGYDIIFFWVIRMVFSALEQTGKVPFHTVLIHGLVRDSQGRKMSKSLGNGIDPLEVIEKYGADALRLTLITGNAPGNDMRFYWERVESARNFANKIWNASRYMLMNLEGFDKDFKPEASDFTLADKWILSRYARTARDVTACLDKFELGEAGRMIYEFIWNEFCDWYIELTKARLYDKENLRAKNTALYVLSYVLEHTLRLLHPFMPFLTEEIWQKVPHDESVRSIMISEWPTGDEGCINDDIEAQMTAIMETIKTVRNLRAEVGAAPGKKSEVILNFTDETLRPVFESHKGYLVALAAAEPVTLLAAGAGKPENAMAGVVGGVEIYLPLKGLIDVEKETARLTKEMDKLGKEIKKLNGKLRNEGFLKKAPAQVVEGERTKLAGYEEKMKSLEARLADLKKL